MAHDRDNLTVLVTGASGNIGQKLLTHFLNSERYQKVIGVDPKQLGGELAKHPKLQFVKADLADIKDRNWMSAFEGVDTVVHLAAQNPYPDASWADATVSVDITLNVVAAMRAAGVERLVFASSNHVMGGYKDADLGPGELTADLTPRPGLKLRQGGGYMVSTAYATAKTMGERIVTNWVYEAPAKRSCVSVRIGWCQPGENLAEDISLEAVPGVAANLAEDMEGRQELKWARDMWFSNRDLQALFNRAAVAGATDWPTPVIVVNGNSDNTGMPWNLDTGRRWLNYAPHDNLYETVKAQ